MDAADFAAGQVNEPEVDDFVDEGDDEPQLPPVSAREAVMAEPTNVTALAEAPLPQYLSVARGRTQSRPMSLPQNITALPRTTVSFLKHEEGIVVMDLFLGVGTALLSLLKT